MAVQPLSYREGQLAIQNEANSRRVAESLAHWVGPTARFARGADLFLLATWGAGGVLETTALSGPSPLLQVTDEEPDRLLFAPELQQHLQLREPLRCGGLAIRLEAAERARINGTLQPADGSVELRANELFTLCRKYMAPSAALDQVVHVGPLRREAADLHSAWARQVLAEAQTTFLLSASPDRAPDVAHRGGPPGFVRLDSASDRVTWDEWVGGGVFKSAGNVRATAAATLCVLDLASGDALELVGHGAYETLRAEQRQRTDALLQLKKPFPVQGRMVLEVHEARRLVALVRPRHSVPRIKRITSRSTIQEQAPIW